MGKFLEEVEDYLRATGMVATRFGPAIGMSRTFVHDLRRGVGTSLRSAEKARAFMAANPPAEDVA